ncbi:GIY-YIG nuclease family protein [Actinoplanes sp. NBRC 103695]|uniref:GIY-YIG nuclease family protein n=1 Tax=Actinoplanes sp. NBRC 103695 TaxID=3032202 RepID=UPI0024A0A892|nr:hypothetical protein [Actinoplanes sp. NBRC 103695]GLY99946.1 hypothetical protein Acsp02_71990 [Actinoplanes sp. NBRC 103695]
MPRKSGVYGWYFDETPPGVPTDGCHSTDAGQLLYVGIAPREPAANGASPSRQTLRNRLRNHCRGNASSSTLRLTLGCLLAERLDLGLRRVGNSARLTFVEGEHVLSAWMADHARVAWMEHEEPWLLELELIKNLVLPLNLKDNSHGPFRAALRAARAAQREIARTLPVVPGPGGTVAG